VYALPAVLGRPPGRPYSYKEDDRGQHCRCQTNCDDAPTIQAAVSHADHDKPKREKAASAICAKNQSGHLGVEQKRQEFQREAQMPDSLMR
jgi:hypothetical protein